MKSKLFFSLFALAFVIVAFLSYGVFKNRYFEGSKKEIINKNSSTQDYDESINIQNQDTGQENSKNSGQEEKNTVAPKIEVTPKDCDNDCSKFKKENEKEYCQEICGTKTYFEDASDSGGSSDDCTSEKGVQKDYCLKDIAVGNKDFKACEEIADANIKKSCKSRITEDLIESQNAAE
jgi:hypothetical protein